MRLESKQLLFIGMVFRIIVNIMTNYHLVILKRPYLEAILAGCKKVESRFTRTRRAPFGRVSVGDKIFFKLSSGPVCATAMISAVKHFEKLTPKQILKLKEQYNQLICGSDEYWQSKAESNFGFFIWLDKVRSIEPVKINKKDMRAWVILSENYNFGLY